MNNVIQKAKEYLNGEHYQPAHAIVAGLLSEIRRLEMQACEREKSFQEVAKGNKRLRSTFKEVSGGRMSTKPLTEKEAAEIIGASPAWLRAKRHYGGGPKYIKFGDKNGAVRYRLEDLQEWLKARERSNTSQS